MNNLSIFITLSRHQVPHPVILSETHPPPSTHNPYMKAEINQKYPLLWEPNPIPAEEESERESPL
jgi:hypothetical protein